MLVCRRGLLKENQVMAEPEVKKSRCDKGKVAIVGRYL